MQHVRKVGVSAAAVALAASGIFALFATSASAGSKPHGKIVCSTMSGSVGSGTITISGCSGTASTGGSSQPLSIALLANGGPVTWTNNDVTTFGKPTLNSTGNPKHCPGYTKPTKTNPTPPNQPSLTSFTGAVTSDNTGMKVPGKYKGYVCISSSGNFSAPKPLKVN